MYVCYTDTKDLLAWYLPIPTKRSGQPKNLLTIIRGPLTFLKWRNVTRLYLYVCTGL